jgi:ABC-type polysaccharide/polyol phosphate transport system ATPase subunit
MTAEALNGVRPVAISAVGLSKHYSLGELYNLRKTMNRLLRRDQPFDPGLEALSDVDFTVYRGESFGLVGTNGSG